MGASLADCQHITAAILAGGLGRRLRPALNGIPKVLAQVGHRPFITFILDRLASAGVRKTILLTGYEAAQVSRTLGNDHAGMTLTYSVENSPMGTAGALRQALPQFDTETLMLLNGDSFCETDLPGLVRAHQGRQAELTLTVTHLSDTSRFGQVTMAPDGKVIHFGEKTERVGPGWINAGIYVLARSLVAEIPPDQCCSLERDFLPRWIHSRPVYGFKGPDRFLDIGTPASYADAALFFKPRAEVLRSPRVPRWR